jgi:hypothetical protein
MLSAADARNLATARMVSGEPVNETSRISIRPDADAFRFA